MQIPATRGQPLLAVHLPASSAIARRLMVVFRRALITALHSSFFYGSAPFVFGKMPGVGAVSLSSPIVCSWSQYFPVLFLQGLP